MASSLEPADELLDFASIELETKFDHGWIQRIGPPMRHRLQD
jgi:hypothetical protein